MLYKDALAEAEKRSKLYDATMFADHAVRIVQDEGSSFFWMNATREQLDHKWMAVYTEHHGVHVFDIDDLVVCQEYVLYKS